MVPWHWALLGSVLLGLTNDFVAKQQKENKHVENIYWVLSWEAVQPISDFNTELPWYRASE